MLVLGADPLGYTNGCYSFDVQAQTGQVVVIEASTNLAYWTAILTNTAGIGPLHFHDPEITNYPYRFYRAASW